MTGPVTVPEILSAYVTVDDDGIKLNPRGADGLAVAVLIIPEKKYASWHAIFPAGLDKALKDHYRTVHRLFFLVKDMPDGASNSFPDNGVTLFLSGYGDPLPVGEWAAELPKELPVITYSEAVKMMGGPKTAAGKSQRPKDGVKAGRPEPKPKQPIQSSDGVSMQMTGDNEIVGAGKKKAVSAPEATTEKRTSEPFGVDPIPAGQFRNFIPEGMRKAHRWGVVDPHNKKPAGNIGAPEWDRDFEEARRWRDKFGGHKRVLGYCFGGCSNYNTETVRDDDHGNLTAEEAKIQGKPVGALYMRPEPRYGTVDIDHVLNKATRELRQDLPEELAAEIRIMTAAFPTEVSVSGTGLHVIFEKREGWPEFTKIRDNIGEFGREVFSGFGYINFTGDQWKKDQKPATQEQKDAAYKLLLDIIDKHDQKEKGAGRPVARPAAKTGNGCGGQQEPARKVTDDEIKIVRTWLKPEAEKVKTHMTEDKIGYGGENQASEAMMSIMSRIAGDAAEDAYKHGISYEAYVRPKIIQKLWEQSETFKKHYKSGEHDYNDSKITATIGKAIDSGRQKYNELSQKVREGVKGEQPKEQPPEYTPEQAEEARKIYERGGMLQYLRDSIHKEHTGDDHIVDAMILSAACIYVQNSDGIHISVSGETGTGKSHVTGCVVNRMPEKMVLNGGLSNRALYYMVIPDGTVIILDDQSMSPELQEVMKTGTTGWEKPAKYHTVGKENGKNTAITLALPTHAPWWIIKANLTGDEQVMDRMLVLHTDDSPEQHRAILNRILHESNERPDTGIEKALWACLESVTVKIPYIDHIGFEDTMNPRNLNLFKDILKAHAVLHAPKRERDGGIIYASKEDFDAAIALFRPLLHGKGGSQALKITKKQQEILNYLCERNTENVIPYEEAAQAVNIGVRMLRYHLHGREVRCCDGLYTICPAISPDEYTAPDNSNNPHRKTGIKINREKYRKWILMMETGVYWIE